MCPPSATLQIYDAAGTTPVTGPVSLAGATGAGTSAAPFVKTINLPFGEYTVRVHPVLPYMAAHWERMTCTCRAQVCSPADSPLTLLVDAAGYYLWPQRKW